MIDFDLYSLNYYLCEEEFWTCKPALAGLIFMPAILAERRIMKETLVLKNGEIIPLEAGGRLDALCVRSENRVSMVDIWEQLTEANLVEVKIKNGDGAIVGNYTDLILVSETSIVDLDGSVSTSFCLREKTEVEKRLDKLEAGQEVQNGAIDDLGVVTSLIADQIGEGGEG